MAWTYCIGRVYRRLHPRWSLYWCLQKIIFLFRDVALCLHHSRCFQKQEASLSLASLAHHNPPPLWYCIQECNQWNSFQSCQTATTCRVTLIRRPIIIRGRSRILCFGDFPNQPCMIIVQSGEQRGVQIRIKIFAIAWWYEKSAA